MIYEQSEIKELLHCEHCSQSYGDYYQPKILSCCGKTIYGTCVQLIENQVKCPMSNVQTGDCLHTLE